MAEIAAVILAAGLSSRMSHFKPLLDLDGRTALERSIRLFYEAGIKDVVVVTGNRSEEVCAEAEACGARTVHNSLYREGMFSSVQCGARSVGDGSAFFILPVDIPLVRSGTVRLLKQQRRHSLEKILIPSYGDARGHPPLLPPDMREAVLSYAGGGGLAGLLNTMPERIEEVPTADSHILMDMDTDEDAQKITTRVPYLEYPDREECETFLCLTPNVTPMGIAHSRAVERCATAMANALIEAKYESKPDCLLVVAAALLHDIAKGLPDHEQEGGRMLVDLGFPKVADIVAAHRDIAQPDDAPLTERELVYLADKLVQGTRLVSVKERFGAKLKRHGHDPEAAEAILGRMKNAERVFSRLEGAAGKPVLSLLADMETESG